MKNASSWQGWTTTLVLTIAVSVVWAVLLAWGMSIVQSLTRTAGVHESVFVSTDGTPLIASRTLNSPQAPVYLTLDREPIDTDSNASLQGGTFPAPYQRPRIMEHTMDWHARIAGISNMARPSAAWYVVRDGQRPGHAYVAAFDSVTKLPVAYASKSGVRPTPPEPAEWFEVGNQDLGPLHGGIAASTASPHPGNYVYQYGYQTDDSQIPMWNLYLVDADDVVEIDTRQQKTRVVGTTEGLQSLAMLSMPLSEPPGEPPQRETDKQGSRHTHRGGVPVRTVQTGRLLAAPLNTFVPAASAKDRKVRPVVGARGAEEITILWPDVGVSVRYPVPEDLRAGRLTAYTLAPDRLLLHTFPKHPYPGVNRLTWLNPEGEVLQDRLVEVGVGNQPTTIANILFTAAIAPASLVWVLALVVGGPLSMLQTGRAATYSAGLAMMPREMLLVLLGVVLLGAVLAALTWREHRRLYRSHPWRWAMLVLLLGPAGWLAYRLHWRRPVVEPCPACGARAPRDRDHCAACNAEWPQPALLGTEVFA